MYFGVFVIGTLYYVRTKGWMGDPEYGNFFLVYVMTQEVGGSKKHQNTLT